VGFFEVAGDVAYIGLNKRHKFKKTYV